MSPQRHHLGLQVGHPGGVRSGLCWLRVRGTDYVAPPPLVSKGLTSAPAASSAWGMSCSGTEAVDGRQLDSYLSELSSRLKGSELASPSSRRSSRSSGVMVPGWEGGEVPNERLLSDGSTRRYLGVCL